MVKQEPFSKENENKPGRHEHSGNAVQLKSHRINLEDLALGVNPRPIEVLIR